MLSSIEEKNKKKKNKRNFGDTMSHWSLKEKHKTSDFLTTIIKLCLYIYENRISISSLATHFQRKLYQIRLEFSISNIVWLFFTPFCSWSKSTTTTEKKTLLTFMMVFSDFGFSIVLAVYVWVWKVFFFEHCFLYLPSFDSKQQTKKEPVSKQFCFLNWKFYQWFTISTNKGHPNHFITETDSDWIHFHKFLKKMVFCFNS